MGKITPTEDRVPTTTDLSKVRSGGITKGPQAKTSRKPMPCEDEVRIYRPDRGYASALPDKNPKSEIIELDRESNDEEEEDGESEEEEDEESEVEDEEEDEEEDDDDDGASDCAWEEEWEEDGDAVTCVQLPEPQTPASNLTVQHVFVVTSEHEHRRDFFGDKFHEVHGMYSHIGDANRAAQKQAQGSFMLHGDRYKEHVHCDGTFHVKAKGGRNERLSIDVKRVQYTVRKEVAVVALKPAAPSEP